MTRKMKRTLSLVLALIMLCSTMGVMAFAQEQRIINCHECPVSSCSETRCVNGKKYREFDRIVECPTHGLHDAERYYVHYDHKCAACGVVKETYVFDHFEYVCLN